MLSRVRAGLVITVAALVGLSALSAFRQGWLTPRSTLHMVLAANPSLTPGLGVRIKGFEIGRVEEVALGADAQVRVTLRVETRYLPLIAKDARLRMARDGFVGARFLEFAGGSPAGARVAQGDTVPFDPEVDWAAQASTLLPQVKEIVANLKLLSAGAADARTDLQAAAANLASLTRQAQQQSGPLLAGGQRAVAGVVATTQDVQTVVAGLKGRMPGLMDDVEGTLKAARQSADQVQTATQGLAVAVTRARETLELAQPDVVRALRSGRSASEDAAAVVSGLRDSTLYRTLSSPLPPPPPLLDPYDDLGSR